MILDFKSFLALSVAAHVTVMFAWVAPPPDAGAPGQVLQLDITDRAGETMSPAAIETGSVQQQSPAAAEQADAPVEHVAAALEVSNRPVAGTNPRATDTFQPEAPIAKAVDAQGGGRLAASSALPSRDESDRHLRNSVMQLVTERLSYPAIARRKGWQGVVTLELHIESNGLISDLQVSETSGYAALDQAAVKSLQLASIPGAGQWLRGRSVDMLIPVEYRLLDS
ncbi:MAG: TonB family protein [Gammaproteobacteria bacterium]